MKINLKKMIVLILSALTVLTCSIVPIFAYDYSNMAYPSIGGWLGDIEMSNGDVSYRTNFAIKVQSGDNAILVIVPQASSNGSYNFSFTIISYDGTNKTSLPWYGYQYNSNSVTSASPYYGQFQTYSKNGYTWSTFSGSSSSASPIVNFAGGVMFANDLELNGLTTPSKVPDFIDETEKAPFDSISFSYWFKSLKIPPNGTSGSDDKRVGVIPSVFNDETELVASKYDSTDGYYLSFFLRNKTSGDLMPIPTSICWKVFGGYEVHSNVVDGHKQNYFYFSDEDFGLTILKSNFKIYPSKGDFDESYGWIPDISEDNSISGSGDFGGGSSSGGNISIDSNGFDIGQFLNSETMQGFLSILSGFFSFLPPWLWTLLGSAIVISTALAIYKFIRG